MNICVIVPENNLYSETFVRAHIERLPGKVTYLYGGLFPTRKADGSLLLSAPSFLQKIVRTVLIRVFKMSLERKALSQFLKDNKIDAVLAEYGPTGVMVMDVCREAGVALIVHFHGYDAYEFETLEKFGERYRDMFQKADAIVAVSRHMEQKLISLGAPKEKVHYSPCGMDAKIFHGSDPSKAAPIFLTTGRFVDKKGPHLTIQAFAKVYAQVPQAKLIMVGNGPLLDICISLSKTLGVNKAVDFVGVQPSEKVAQFMREARAFVQHSRVPSSGDSEGTPVAVQEAGGSGLPVVATLHAGIPDVVQDGVTGFLVKEEDIEGMADKMLKLAQDAGLAKRMGDAARERVLANFTLDQSIERLNSAIEAAVKHKGTR